MSQEFSVVLFDDLADETIEFIGELGSADSYQIFSQIANEFHPGCTVWRAKNGKTLQSHEWIGDAE